MAQPGFLGRRLALGVAAAWGFAEATLFVIVPDVWVGAVALVAPRRAIGALLAAAAGAIAGATVLFGLAPIAGTMPADLIASLPGIDRADLATAADELRANGTAAIVTAPLAGMPIKVHVLEASLLGLPLPWVLAAVAVNRLVRIGVVAAGWAIAGRLFAPAIGRHPRRALAAHAAFWAFAYLGYFLTR